jgi:hypothetical protein
MSKKGERIDRQLHAYAALCERCAVCWWPRWKPKFGKVICLHHIVGRRGLDYNDHRNLIGVCEECHETYHSGGHRDSDGNKKDLTLGHILTAKREEDGDLDIRFLARLMRRVGLREDPKPLPDWVKQEREHHVHKG